jgi:ribosomal protein S12 methylthiotransferase
MMVKRKVDIITLGCSKNLVDSEQLIRQFDALGYKISHDSDKPDGEIVVVNTCGFIGDAKEESINTILQLANLKKQKQIDKLFVMGCLSERYKNELEKEIPEVDRYFGKFNYNEILTEIGQEYRADLRLERTLTTPSHYAYVKISEGCDRTCSYCAIPLITGKHRSRSIEDLEKEVRILVDKGVKEFQLIAQDLSYYGIDRYKKSQLAELLRRLSDIKGVEWLRLHYAYPANFPFEILKVMQERENICKYIDIALQHISDNMLSLMRRNISKERTYNLIRRIRDEVPGIHIRTTMIIGHPGETEQDNEELKEFLSDMRFERMGAFIYSHEESTYAYNHYKDNIPLDIKQQRMNEIMSLQEKISTEINSSKIGSQMKVIIDRQEQEYYIGRSEFDSPEVDPEVLIPISTPNIQIGKFYNTKIVDATAFDLYGI